MKKLLKSEVYGTREQYTGALFTTEKSKHAVGNKKKKERNANVDPRLYYGHFSFLQWNAWDNGHFSFAGLGFHLGLAHLKENSFLKT